MSSDKISCVFAFILFASLVETIKGQENDLSSAVNSFINYFGSFNATVNLINAVTENGKFVDDVLKKTSVELETALEVADTEYTNNNITDMRLSYVLIADKFEDVNKFFSCFSSKIFDVRGYFLIVVLTRFEQKDIAELYQMIWKAQIFNLNIVHAEEGEVFSTMFVPFRENSCDGKLTNETFVRRKFVSDLEKIFPSMITDLKNCPIRVTTFEDLRYVMKKGEEISGRDYDLIKTISTALHFTLDIQFITDQSPWELLFENGTGTLKLINNETDIIIGGYFLINGRQTFLDHSVPYYVCKLIYVIPPPAPFSSLKKLSQPFQQNVWICLIFFYITAALSIIAISQLDNESKIKSIVFGFNITSPFTNMILITLGITQPKVPQGSFSRTIFLMFIMFCLVMRSSYQGSLYRFLQSDGFKIEIKSFDDLMDKEFNFYLPTINKEFTHNHPDFYKRKVIVPGTLEPIFRKLNNPQFKGSVIIPLERILVYNSDQTYNMTFNYLRGETFTTFSVVLYYRKNFFIAPAMNEVIQRLQSAGVIDYWHKHYYKITNVQNDEITRQPLNINHLRGIFYIWTGGSAIALIIFVLENILQKIQNFRERN